MGDRAERVRAVPGSTEIGNRLARLRARLRRRRLAGFIVPRADEHQSEYVSECSERLAWISGFTGSAGSAIILTARAALFIDGRYTEQARGEVDTQLFELRHITEQPPASWLEETLKPGDRLGYDPWLHTAAQLAPLEDACARVGARLTPVRTNPLDSIWRERPPPPLSPLRAQALAFTGVNAADKRRALAERLVTDRQQAVVLSALDSIAWLLNIRGDDVPFTPLALAFAILHANAEVDLFVDARQVTPAIVEHLGEGVRRHDPAELGHVLDGLGAARAVVRVDPETTPVAISRRLRVAGAQLACAADPCVLPKATKNEVELAGMRAAHVRDGIALCRFLAWFEDHVLSGNLTESAAAEQLARFRALGEHYQGPSFPTISAAAAHGAIVHYRVTPASDRRIAAPSLYLIDSGGQYFDGTTDVTRTLAVGEPTARMRECFTRVLRGHIALASARFPRGTSGSQLDALARLPLWEVGLDYDHGTGHGVGAYLGVHEGPQRISKIPNRVALVPGMILSNEPGYYQAGAYGIRIENLVAVVPAETPAAAEQAMLAFETLTLAPIDRRLVEPGLLRAEERRWLDAYHDRVRQTLTPCLDAATARWLAGATAPISGLGEGEPPINDDRWSGRRPGDRPDELV